MARRVLAWAADAGTALRGSAILRPRVDQEQAVTDDRKGPEPIELPITDVLDLHSFPPREVTDLVRSYLDAASEKGLLELRIIHGRGIGAQRRTVRSVLDQDPRVVSYSDAPPEAGGWGATCVTLLRPSKSDL